MTRIQWTDEKVDRVRSLLAEAIQAGITVKTEAFAYVSERMDEHPNYNQLQRVVWGNGLWEQAREIAEHGGPEPKQHVAPQFPDLVEEEFDWREWVKAAVEMQDLHQRAEITQNTCTVDLTAVDRPIAVMFTADWHLGSLGTDYRSWMQDIEYVIDTPDLYLGVVGDVKDNFRYFRDLSAILSQLFPPHIQTKMVGEVTKELVKAGKLLFHTWGNHDYEWDTSMTGYSHMVELIHSAGVPFLSGQGLVNLLVGQQRYPTLVIHRTRFNSYLHTLHGNKRAYELIYPARIVVTAHTHNPDYETFTRYDLAESLGEGFGGTSYLVKCGTYKLNDGYSARNFGLPRCATITCVLYPDRQKVVPFQNAEDAVRFMRAH